MGRNKPIQPDILQHTGDEPHFLREIVRTYQGLMSGFSREVGMPASRLALMRILINALPDAVGIMDLARTMGINAAAVTRQVKEMEGENLIIRRSDARDGRRSYIKLSAKGVKVFKRIHERSHELERSLLLSIHPEEIKATVDVLSRLRCSLEGLREHN
jgi:DNA-binding MarR family transcriptional regulator